MTQKIAVKSLKNHKILKFLLSPSEGGRYIRDIVSWHTDPALHLETETCAQMVSADSSSALRQNGQLHPSQNSTAEP